MKRNHGLDVNPLTDFVISVGQTEAFAAAMFAIVDHGDEVLLFDPVYETYGSCIALAGGIPEICNLPHNPTGKVFSMEELQVIAEACCSMDCIAVTDEVYE